MKELENLRGRRVLVTGHTGFKGSWMCETLLQAGAEVTGYALQPPTEPSLFALCGFAKDIRSIKGDVRDQAHLQSVFQEVKPEVVIHMAAQPIVRSSYDNPAETYAINVMGTVHVMEAVRLTRSVRSVVNVTTDKVYKNREWCWGYREDEELNGYDPYSNSKSCSELVTDSYRNSFFRESGQAVSTMRAGNVIGGGDFAKDRIIPDCIRAASAGVEIILRNPYSTRPYQHVLEPVMAYLMVAAAQLEQPELADSYNVGPEEADCRTTGEIADLFCETWNGRTGEQIRWVSRHDGGPHEANFLKLDCSKLKSTFGWKPHWHVEQAMEEIVSWALHWRQSPGTLRQYIAEQVKRYQGADC
ncbi:MAG: CDP-glucose 4,6-dehydratase [Eubacterium sp.]|nr:CDP-glucose 4,6-dehydratase [Eubacterium sp.]